MCVWIIIYDSFSTVSSEKKNIIIFSHSQFFSHKWQQQWAIKHTHILSKHQNHHLLCLLIYISCSMKIIKFIEEMRWQGGTKWAKWGKNYPLAIFSMFFKIKHNDDRTEISIKVLTEGTFARCVLINTLRITLLSKIHFF